MKYFAAVGDRSFECRVETRDGATFVVVDGEPHRVDMERITGTDSYSLLLEGRSYEFTLHDRQEEIELSGAAGHFHILVEDERTRAARAATAHARPPDRPATVRSAMPGIVREVLVGAGDMVEKGQPLLILEAMKMQNEIRADREGRVQTLHVRPGTTVEKGAPLLELG